jgi:hypothetical protein
MGWVLMMLRKLCGLWRRGLNERCAGMVYQVSFFHSHLSSLIELLQIIVSSILLRPHATETDATMLLSTSTIRVLVEELRMDILRWLRKRWMGVRQSRRWVQYP